MNAHRGSPLWIAGRIGILIVFVLMPMQRACYRLKLSFDVFDDTRFHWALSNADAALHPYNPTVWSNWMAIVDEELKKSHEFNAIHHPVKAETKP